MSSNSNPKPQDEEIDLGQLFNAIGRLFERIFRLISNIFKGIFYFTIDIVLFLRKYVLILAIATIVGYILGYFIKNTEETKYISSMIVQPNFNSTEQLYTNIEFYNDIAKSKDSATLSKALKISIAESSTLKGFNIEAHLDESQKMQYFDDFIKNLDTTTIKSLNFEEFKKDFNPLNAKMHKITVISTNNLVAKKLEPVIVEAIESNAYFNLMKSINDNNIILKDSIYKKELSELEALQKVYKEVLIEESKKSIASTSINLANEKVSKNKEIDIINKIDQIKDQMVILNIERGQTAKIINIISEFPNRGVKEVGLLKNKSVLFSIIFAIITLFVLLFLKFNRYLNKLQKSKL